MFRIELTYNKNHEGTSPVDTNVYMPGITLQHVPIRAVNDMEAVDQQIHWQGNDTVWTTWCYSETEKVPDEKFQRMLNLFWQGVSANVKDKIKVEKAIKGWQQ